MLSCVRHVFRFFYDRTRGIHRRIRLSSSSRDAIWWDGAWHGGDSTEAAGIVETVSDDQPKSRQRRKGIEESMAFPSRRADRRREAESRKIITPCRICTFLTVWFTGKSTIPSATSRELFRRPQPQPTHILRSFSATKRFVFVPFVLIANLTAFTSGPQT